jgi:signal transduction histidine kinase
LTRYLREKHGTDVLERILTAAGLAVGDFDGKSRWTSLESFEAFLKGVREVAGSDEEFQRACIYRMSESYGVFRFAFRALSPLAVFLKAMSQFHLVSRVGRFEVLASGRTFLEYRHYSTKREDRLVCLSRQAQSSALPTMWGLPGARITERKCVAFGNDCCELKYQWYEHRRPLPMFIGALAGAAAAFALSLAGLGTLTLWLGLPILCGLVGYVLELRRSNKANLAIGEEMNEALVGLAAEDADARREVLALNQRQKEWTRVLEEQVAERTASVEAVVRRLQNIREDLQTNLRGVSHDLQSPLFLIRALNESMLEDTDGLSPELVENLKEQGKALVQMSAMFQDLMTLVRADAPLLRLAPQNVETEPLLDQLRRRVRALVIGREIRVSTLASRETPPRIETDLLLFDRVIDNLLTNAAKYTERGSIVIELDGKPGFLTVKVSDTGRGIEEDDIRKIFEPDGSAKEARAKYSHGVGLSVVVKLLAQIGGKLEVMSLPGMGTTFWAHFPVEISTAAKEVAQKDERVRDDDHDSFNKVVTIRRSRGR